MVFLMKKSNRKLIMQWFFGVFLMYGSSFAQTPTKPTPSNKKQLPQTEDLILDHEDDLPTVSSAASPTTSSPTIPLNQRIIEQIVITGNRYTPREAIINHIPYAIGEQFNPNKTSTLVRNVYNNLKRFRNVRVYAEPIGTDRINLHVKVEEKVPIKDFVFKGNKHLTEDEIKKKVDLTMPMIDPEELDLIANHLKKLYAEKGYIDVTIAPTLNQESDGLTTALFTIQENKPSIVKRVMFKGNKHIPSKRLKNMIFTREDWLLSFMDKAGTFHQERLEGDKYMIEQAYQNEGFIQAKVIDVTVDKDPKNKNITVTYDIEEGNRYKIAAVHAPGNDILPEPFLLSCIPIRPGDWYSREAIVQTIKMLERLWGNYGYIFASIEPSIEPNEENKTIEISFISDIGKLVRLRNLTIKGNKKTRDKVIRRRLLPQEQELLTNNMMEFSKNSIESLGYFEQNGVDWRVNRVNEEEVDLDLVVQEAKTGHLNAQLEFGGADFKASDPVAGLKFRGSIMDSNLFGTGMAVRLEGSWAKQEQTILFHISQPWLFDKPITGAMDIYHRRPVYDQLMNVAVRPINSVVTGGSLTAGFITRPTMPWFANTQFLSSFGIDNVTYNPQPRASSTLPPLAQVTYQSILDNEFSPGDFTWLAVNIDHDELNHPIHTSRGLKWTVNSKFAIPSFRGNIGFARLSIDTHWFTPLIDELNLVLHLHGFMGIITPIGKRTVPFGELFHVGGEGSVRGFLWGQLEPKFADDPIGAKKAFFINAELVFPVAPDNSIKGIAFYDGGTGWDNPFVSSANGVRNNSFDYRHAVGLGVRLFRPMPIRIDWGFKLDARRGESASEIHFGTSLDW